MEQSKRLFKQDASDPLPLTARGHENEHQFPARMVFTGNGSRLRRSKADDSIIPFCHKMIAVPVRLTADGFVVEGCLRDRPRLSEGFLPECVNLRLFPVR